MTSFPSRCLPFLALLVLSFAPNALAQCTSFTLVTNQSLYYPPAHAYRTSPALTCTNGNGFGQTNTFCHAPNCSISGTPETITVTGYTNISSLSTSDTESLFQTVASSTGVSFDYSQTGNDGADGGLFCLVQGTSGYTTFRPYGMCYNGTFQGCSSDFPLANNTPIMLCRPQASSSGPYLNGELSMSLTTAAEAANLTSVPMYTSGASTLRMGTVPMGWWTGAVGIVVVASVFSLVF